MRPVYAILIDSIRQLRAKRLFWFVLALSGLIVVAYGSIGFNDKGVTIIYGLKEIEQPLLVKGSMLSRMLMDVIFSVFIVNIWLAWGAMILAIVSTCGILPDFLADGSIDLVLSKPISRIKVFLSKYFGSLMFVFLQVLIFAFGIFLVLGFRLDEWRWKVFLVVPLITLMFSYLYSITALVNVWTRSTLASLLVTVIAWFGIFSFQTADGILQMLRINCETQISMSEARILEAEEMKIAGDTDPEIRNELIRERIEPHKEAIEDAEKIMDTAGIYIKLTHALGAITPKTGETVALMQRALEADADMTFGDFMRGDWSEEDREKRGDRSNADAFFGDPEVQLATTRRFEAYVSGRSVWFVVGTSMAFQLVLVTLACFIFVRQDF